MRPLALFIFIVDVVVAPSAWAVHNVVGTRHNLSVSGPGTVKSATVTEVCVFCHTPHNSRPDAPLWNHQDTAAIFTPYSSTTLVAPTPGQPSGMSRLCLSCHDGTVALGALQNPPTGNDLSATFLTGADRGFLDTDLRDDHPISFAYDAALQAANPELANPAAISLPLEGDQLQCTTCHDPHEADLKPFLRETTLNGTLCTTCHLKTDWAGSTHATSTAAVAATDLDNRRPEWVAPTVAGNSCLSCHTPHNTVAANPQRLLAKNEEDTCYSCHDANGPGTDIQADFAKLGGIHPVADPSYAGLHDATKVEDPASMPLHVECMDCHNPHTVTPGALPMISFNPNNLAAPHSTPPAANAMIRDVTGLDVNGNPTTTVTNQYELCFKCHGRPGEGPCGGISTSRCSTAVSFSQTRQDSVYNIRDKVYSGTPGLVSYHPIESNNPDNNAEVPSLRNDVATMNRTAALIYCTDCHNSNTSSAAGGVGPNGPHGSTYDAILTQEYSFNPRPNYNAARYRLCYKCHDESAIMNDVSGAPHRMHLTNEQEACINCHDPHGSHRFSHLLDFLTNSNFGGSNRRITGAGGFSEPTWQDRGTYRGACYMNCHGQSHSPETY